jgi:hypothetical protein
MRFSNALSPSVRPPRLRRQVAFPLRAIALDRQSAGEALENADSFGAFARDVR